jgi:cell division protein FtsL
MIYEVIMIGSMLATLSSWVVMAVWIKKALKMNYGNYGSKPTRNWKLVIKRFGISVGLSLVALFVCIATIGITTSTDGYKAQQAQLASEKAQTETKNKEIEAENARIKAENDKQAAAKKTAEDAVKQAQEAAKQTPEYKYNEWVQSHFSGWDGSNSDLKSVVKESMNNPDSFKHVETTYKDLGNMKGIEIYMVYRGTNAFGGMVTNAVKGTFLNDGTTKFRWQEVQ